jgi:hypothetical protein
VKIYATLLLACALSPAAAPLAAQTLDQALALYYQNQLHESLPILRQLAAADPASVEVRAWLADNLRRTGNAPDALAVAREVLADEPCNAHAHDVVAAVMGQEFWEAEARDSAWAHATAGVECDPDDGNLWLTYWMTAMMRQDTAGERRAQRRVGELRFIPEPVMELSRWMLRASKGGALLFAYGDWDYLPLKVAQTAEGLRPDVTVILLPMMEVPWYVRRMAAWTGYPVPAELEGVGDYEAVADDAGNGLITGRVAALWTTQRFGGRNSFPLFAAGTSGPEWLEGIAWPRWDGPVYELRPLDKRPPGEDVIDATGFCNNLPHVEMARLQGPITHPSDRSPIRRTGVHPAEHVMAQLYAYGAERVNEGRMDYARQALAQMQALRAGGHVRGEYAELERILRAIIEEG